MLTIKRSARVSITTGTAILKEVAGGDPNNEGLILMGVASGDDRDGDSPWCLPLHSLCSFRGQVPRVTQRPPFGCISALIPCCLHDAVGEKDDGCFFRDASN